MNKYIPTLMRIFSLISAITMIVLLVMYIKTFKYETAYPLYIMFSFISTGLFLALSKLTDDKNK